VFEWAADLARRTSYKFYGRWRNHGHPSSAKRWDTQYRKGKWDCLERASEVAHYGVIMGYCRHFAQRPAILDVGCGHGVLYKFLQPLPREAYHGIDLSEEAIKRVRKAADGDSGATFLVADFETWNPPRLYDVIIFCESLHYANRPVQLFGRYAEALADNGVLIVSLFRHTNSPSILQEIEARFAVRASSTVHVENGPQWDVRALANRGTLPGGSESSPSQHPA
jgi:2-polyprenyl-3-methyl-5-hydroxy-6-metoxy-1,4-benzoquinol methylase